MKALQHISLRDIYNYSGRLILALNEGNFQW